MESLEFKVGNAKRVCYPRLIKSLSRKSIAFFPQFLYPPRSSNNYDHRLFKFLNCKLT